MNAPRLVGIGIFLALLPLNLHAQAAPPPPCPVGFVYYDPDGISLRIQNLTTKQIVGLSFFAAVSDPTEHSRWIYSNYPPYNQLREFGWNRTINPGASKTASWGGSLDFDHAGASVLILTSVLFADGSSWNDPPQKAACSALWVNSHKKHLVHPIELPTPQ